MPPSALYEVEAQLATRSSAHRAFYLPIVRAIAELGGRARKREVTKHVRTLLANHLSERQLDYLELKNRYGWVRLDLRNAGLVVGGYGVWELTELGRAYAQQHARDHIAIALDIPEAEEPAGSGRATESVPVTGFRAYEVPLLQVMAEGYIAKDKILSRMHALLEGKLLPGDQRTMPAGQPVWRFRAEWALSNLGKAGFAENTGTAEWTITTAGRERLAKDADSWDVKAFRSSQAKVRLEGTMPPPPPRWNATLWNALREEIPEDVFERLHARLRPDLGASPEPGLPRNIVLCGPPGTGKTFLAKAVARALTGEREVSDDGRFRLVQFHPSYAYEDFVQGLRPDLKETQLRYQLQKGPFMRIAEAAAQDPDLLFVLVIDEVNRGDPARIFGELLYALEYRDEAVSLPMGGELIVPGNLVIIGTMNSIDRSVALVDYALRRRFGFVRVEPQPDVIAEVRSGLLAEVGPTVLEQFNHWISQRLGREHCLGHSFFISQSIPDDAPDAFDRLWRTDVQPLMEEYFFGDADALAESERRWQSVVRDAMDARETAQ